MSAYKPRLVLHVVWASTSPHAEEIANHLYSRLCREIDHPVSRGIGIPIYFHAGRTPKDALLPDAIVPRNAESTVVIPLVDDAVRASDDWIDCVDELARRIEAAGRAHLFLPVACSDQAYQISTHAAEYNFIRLNSISDDLKPERLVAFVTHEISRLLIGKNTDVLVDDARRLGKSLAPVKLFISHAKHDGLDIAVQLKRYIEEKLPAARFFDSNDNAFGHRFREEIEANVAESALIIVHSDRYSSREWCRREVLLAKRYGCPILVVNAIAKGEDRSFPYLGNVPTMRWMARAADRTQAVLDLALREVLRNVYFKEHVKTLKSAGYVTECVTLTTAPEVLTCLNLIRDNKCNPEQDEVLLYPDPPLGSEEVEVLSSLSGKLALTTPTAIGARRGQEVSPLKGQVIGLSISNSPDLQRLAMTLEHLKDAAVEFARHLLAQGAILAYGGDLRREGFTKTLFELVRVHNEPTGKPRDRILSFLAWPLYCDITVGERADYNQDAILNDVPPPPDLGVDCMRRIKPDSVENRYILARCLTAMREEMNRRVVARVLVGGQIRGHKGRYPGLLEEALLAARSGRPLYLAGGFGGITHSIARAVSGESPAELTLEEQEKDADYKALVERYNAQVDVKGIDYETDLRFLQSQGAAGLNNGLDAAENKILFSTTNIPEMIFLILKGLTKVLR
jgi:SLOG-like protein/TIR domain-containing protein